MQPVVRIGSLETPSLTVAPLEEKKANLEFAAPDISSVACSETEEKQIHADRARQSEIEAKLFEAINAANAALCQNITGKLIMDAVRIQLFGTAEIRAELSKRPVMETKEEKAMLEHTSCIIAELCEQPAFVQTLQPIQLQFGFATMQEMANAYTAPFIKEHVAKIKEISPEHVAALCRVYDQSESKSVLQKVAGCLAIIMTEKLSSEQYKALLEILDATDKKSSLQEKKLPITLANALGELLSMPACSNHALTSIRDEVEKHLTS